MNYHSLTRDEAAFILFSFKKTLRDSAGLTPQMEQFYESGVRILGEKLERIDKAGDGRIEAPKRHRYTEVRATWHPESLAQVSRDLARDNGEMGTD